MDIKLITPLVKLWRSFVTIFKQPWRFAELVLCILLMLAADDYVELFGNLNEHLDLMFVIWAALRFGLHGVLFVIAISAMNSLWGFTHHPQLGNPVSEKQEFLNFWFYNLTLTFVGSMLALSVNALKKEKSIAADAVNALDDAVQRFNQAQFLSRTGCWELEIGSGKLHWSQEIFRIFEIDPKQFSATYDAFINTIHPEDRMKVTAAYENSLLNRSAYEITHRLLMPDGRVKWVNERCDTFYDDNGQPINSIGTVQDITVHKQELDFSLTESESRLNAIFNTVLDSIVVINEFGIVDMVNRATLNIFGYTQVELIGKSVNLLMPVEIADLHDGFIAAFRSSGESRIIGKERSLMGCRKNGEQFPLELAVSEMLLHNKKTFIGVCRDITERKKSEETIHQARRMAELASLAKSQFLATMTHELRTPMNSVLGMMQLVLMEEITQRQRECLLAGQKAGHHLLEIINNILDYTKAEAGKLELKLVDFSLFRVIETLMVLFEIPAQTKGITFSVNLDPSVPDKLHGDPLRLKQILINLIQNAIKFTNQGEVQVNIGPQLGNNLYALYFEVKDSGIGISEQDQEKLFQVFQQVDNSLTRQYGGTGLGLVISKQLAELMQGNISVVSALGQGACFKFEALFRPQQKRNFRPEQTCGFVRNTMHLYGLKMLLIEPDLSAQKRMSRMLMGRGVLVSCASDHHAALCALNEEKFDVVVLALAMLNEEPAAATRLIECCRTLALPVIGLNAPSELIPSHYHQLGFIGFLQRPIDSDQLVEVLARIAA